MSLLIPQKKIETKESSRKLKESIGESTRHTLDMCAALSESVGKLQVEIAAIQKRLFNNVACLIDNSPPYKKATKQELVKTRAILRKAVEQLRSHATLAQQMRVKIQDDTLLAQQQA